MAAALVVGSWHLDVVPAGWEVLPGYGVRQTGQGVFPSVLVLAEEPLAQGTTFTKYVSNQVEGAKVLLPRPNFKGPDAFAVPGATDALRLGVSYQTETGRSAIHFQIYATDGVTVGNATFTTVQEELLRIGVVMAELIRGLTFHSPHPV